MKHTLLCLLSLVAVGVLATPEASAFEFSSTNGCAQGQGARWDQARLPLQYFVNQRGSAAVQMNRVEAVMEASFNAWAEPCSSSFSSRYAGQTQLTAFSTNNQMVLSFVDNANEWPQQLGSANGSTIAVTLGRFQGNCRIYNAPIVFNGVGFRFTEECNANGCTNRGTDLQSIATHEIGHMLGLDHTPIQSATMYFAYIGGDRARSLHPDDVGGVGALYPNVCSCANDAECLGDREECVNQRCTRIPCTSDTQCEDGLECDRGSGDCVIPKCAGDNECPAGFSCLDEYCQSTCPVCRDCTDSNQCGANAVCADLQGDGAGECIVFCGQDGSCPGDGACFQVPGQDNMPVFICLNRDAQNAGPCPDNFVCDNNFMPPPDPCDGVQCADDEFCFQGACQLMPGACRLTCDTPAFPSCFGNRLTTYTPRLNEGSCSCDQVPTETDCAATNQTCQGGECVDVDPMNMNNNNMTMNDMGMTTPPPMEEEEVFIVITPPAQVTDSSCAVSSPGDAPSTPLGLLGLLGLLGFGLRRRRG